MTVHHFNAGSMCPRGRKLFEGHGGLLERARIVSHCVLLELPDRLVLIDTGLGQHDIAEHNRLALSMRVVMHPKLDPAETAIAQVKALGFSPTDVRDIVLTHLDFDHAGGLADFPHASVHVLAREHRAAVDRETRTGRSRYRPKQWAHGPRWAMHYPDGDMWFGFEAVHMPIPTYDGLAIIPLAGHTPGHAGVAFRDGDRWLLHAGDAYFHHMELDPQPYCTPGLRFYQNVMQCSRRLRLENQARLRALANDPTANVRIFCAHDAVELERAIAGRPARRESDIRQLGDAPTASKAG